MTKIQFRTAYRTAVARADWFDNVSARSFGNTMEDCRDVEHVTIVGDGDDFHSSDSARALLEVGYWGTLDMESVS